MRKDLPLRIAYADPPYVGQAKVRYNDEEVDMGELMAYMDDRFDGWAMSSSSSSLGVVLSEAPAGIRVLAWVKTFAAYKRNVRVAFSWEPVIARIPKRPKGSVGTRDFVVARMTFKKGLCGVKPKEFSFWLFNVMGMRVTDKFYDLYPGTGAVTDAWEEWCEKKGPKQQQHVNVINKEVYGAK